MKKAFYIPTNLCLHTNQALYVYKILHAIKTIKIKSPKYSAVAMSKCRVGLMQMRMQSVE